MGNELGDLDCTVICQGRCAEFEQFLHAVCSAGSKPDDLDPAVTGQAYWLK